MVTAGLKWAKDIFPKEYTPINNAMKGAKAANGIPKFPSNISASYTIEPVAKTTRTNVPINSTVKICKFEYDVNYLPQVI